jgi:hypothetical protein
MGISRCENILRLLKLIRNCAVILNVVAEFCVCYKRTSCQITLKGLPVSFLYHKYCNIKSLKECNVKLVLSLLILLRIFRIHSFQAI